MEKIIKISMIPKLLAMSGDGWEKSLTFPEWFKAHDPDDYFFYEATSDLQIFMETDPENPCAAILFKNIDALKNFKPSRKTLIHMGQNLEMPGWEKIFIKRIERKANPSLSKASPFNFKQDDPTGWKELIKNHAPYDLLIYFMRDCEKAIVQKNFICERDKDGIKSIIIWSVDKDTYHGMFWWSRTSGPDAIKDLWNVHRYYENQGIKKFLSQCRVDNIPSWKIHELLGYEPAGMPFYVYISG